MGGFSTTMFNRQIYLYGTDFAAGCNVGKKAWHFINFFFEGIANGYLPLASYNYGARNFSRLYDALAWNIKAQFGYGITAVGLILLKAETFIGLFTKSPEAIGYGAGYLRAYCWSLMIYSIYYLITASLQAAGMGKQSMLLSISRQGLLLGPMIMILPSLFGSRGIFLAQPVSDWLTVAVGLFLSRGLIREILEGKGKTAEESI